MLLQQRPLPRMDSSSWLVCPVAWFRITATGRHISHESIIVGELLSGAIVNQHQTAWNTSHQLVQLIMIQAEPDIG